MSKIEQYILQKLDNLERAFLQSQQNNVKVIENADKAPVIEDEVNKQSEDIKTNTSDISDNREGLTETFEATLTNTDDVAINRQAIEELYEMLTAESEVK